MRFRTGATPLCLVASLALLATTAPAFAAPKRITGKLSKPGYTVIAFAASGNATSVRAGPRFRLRSPAQRVTLHLRAVNGSYAGPVVTGREKKGTRAILGVRAGAKLGEVRIRRGYARASRRVAESSIDPRRWARARRGIPIGAGNFGFVRSRSSRGTVAADIDLDGVPDVLDIDDDGDLVLDNFDRSLAARAAQAESAFHVRSVLAVPIWETANANATTLEDGDINETLTTWGRLILEIKPGDSAELDCGRPQSRTDPSLGGLVYCTRGGTGTAVPSGPDRPPHPSQWPPFPGPAGGQFDSDGDGFGTLTAEPTAPGAAFFFAPVATTAQIGTGDVLIQRVDTGGSESQFTLMLPFVFASTPALVSYDDGQGNDATVSYPVAGPNPGPNPGGGGPGTDDRPFPVEASDGGDVVVTLTFWRPQRRPIPPDPDGRGGDACLKDTPPCEWVDIGALTYAAAAQPAIGAEGSCPQDAFSADPTKLAPADADVPYGPGAGGISDLAGDGPATGNTFTYILNLTKCLRGEPWPSGEARSFNFGAVDSAGADVSVTETVPGVTFELQP